MESSAGNVQHGYMEDMEKYARQVVLYEKIIGRNQ
jgi:hypothetical protein